MLHISDLASSRNVATLRICTNDAAFLVPTISNAIEYAHLNPQLLQMIPPNVRRQQVVFELPHERQVRPIIDGDTSMDMVAGALTTGQFRVERSLRCAGGAGDGDEEMKPLSDRVEHGSLR
jgi:hypothetical protein